MKDSLYKNDIPYEEKLNKAPNVIHFNKNFYCVLRIGKRMKETNSVKQWQRHMQREMQVPNSNGIENTIIIGNKNVSKILDNYLQGVKIRKDNVLCTELLLTATHGFFNMPQSDIDKWVALNLEWIDREFGENCIYCVVHKDESTIHLHLLICPKFENDKGEKILANKRYFGGKVALSNYQTNYAEYMRTTFKQLNRGLRFSKAKHIEIRHFYSMINDKVDIKDLESVVANSVNAELLKLKIKGLEKTMETYKDFWRKSDLEKKEFKENNQELAKEIIELKKNKEVYHQVVEILADRHAIPQNAIKGVLAYVEKELSLEPVSTIKKKTIELEKGR